MRLKQYPIIYKTWRRATGARHSQWPKYSSYRGRLCYQRGKRKYGIITPY